ncbi:hypothetical protein LNV08_16620 [Paucibacter sp. TC2R-5]|uniref:hypothetical protein n=1 Tax=Paucibacter sp. TC2R-5 TaxID=2893555 RepID=UPI0021E4BB4A|nr:hypothetical protein [Paucibacter sp. TC2R-5]MCV2360599.1 hypothetical protein [Paucibacter sp. TC2R-5]
MLHALLHLFSTQPQALAEHAQAYADLFGDEFGQAKQALRRRFVLHAVLMCSVTLGVGLGGVALLLWAVTPPAQIHAAWLLLCVPLPALVLALYCWRAAAASRSSDAAMFVNLRQQLASDRAMLVGAQVSAVAAAGGAQ